MIPRCNIAVIFDRTPSTWCCIIWDCPQLLTSTQLCFVTLVTFCLKFFLFLNWFRYRWLIWVRLSWIDANSGTLFKFIHLANPCRACCSSRCARTLSMFPRYLKPHKAWNSIFANTYRNVMLPNSGSSSLLSLNLIFFFSTLLMLESMNVLSNDWQVALVAHVCTGDLRDSGHRRNASRAFSTLLNTLVSDAWFVVVTMSSYLVWHAITWFAKVVHVLTPSLLWLVSLVHGANSQVFL